MVFSGKVVLVTGGGSGIGAAAARHLAGLGASVLVAGRRMEALTETVAVIAADGGRATAVQADLSVERDAEAMVATAVAAYGRLDFAVNAAGAAGVGTAAESDMALFDRMIDANLKSAWLAMKYEIPAIVAAGGGAIVNIASRAGLVGTAHGALYSAAKHAVLGLTKSAALEAAASGVRINALCPGPTRTAQFDRIVEAAMPGMSIADAVAMFGAKLPLGRIADPDEIAQAAAWMLSPATAFMTGAAVPLDGGSGAG